MTELYGTFNGGCPLQRYVVSIKELFRTTLTNGLYLVDRTPPGNGNIAFHVGSSRSLRLWHQRMGHVHLDAIQQLAQKNMVEGLTIVLPQTLSSLCEGCVPQQISSATVSKG